MFDSKKLISNIEFFKNNDNQITNAVHIALVFDDNYAMPAGITITSVIKNNPHLSFNFHLFVDNISLENINKFKDLVSDYVTIKMYHLNDNFNINENTLILGYLSAISCVRFIVPDILSSETDKFLYLDSDIICLKPINYLYDLDISNYTAAVIPDDKIMKNYIKTLYDIDSDNYFNSGVLLINTKKWVENDLTTRCMNKVNDGNIYQFADQDVLNILLEGQTRLLPIKFNTKIHITTSCMEEKKLAPYTVFLHYVTGYKPWYQVFDSQIFKNYFLLSPWRHVQRPLSPKRSWIRKYAKYCLKRGRIISAIKFYYFYLVKKIQQS